MAERYSVAYISLQINTLLCCTLASVLLSIGIGCLVGIVLTLFYLYGVHINIKYIDLALYRTPCKCHFSTMANMLGILNSIFGFCSALRFLNLKNVLT